MTSRLYFCGPFPPPIHGQAVATKALYDLLETQAFDVITLDTAAKGFGKIVQHLVAFWALLTGPAGPCYVSLNANAGMWLTAFLCLGARLRRRDVWVHHHTRQHLTHIKPAMRAVLWAGGAQAVHISICASMSQALRDRYGANLRTFELSNIAWLQSLNPPLHAQDKEAVRPLVLGHMSNLTFEKGVGRAIDCFRAARARGLAAKLCLAGPAGSPSVQALIQSVQVEFGDQAFEYLGFVDEAGKRKFFDSIDVFLFPSLYENETQGIVNLEALRCGVPVLAYDVCCIGSDLADGGGCAVPPDQDFTIATIDYLSQVIRARTQHAVQAQQRFQFLKQQADQQIQTLIKRLGDAL